MVPVMNDKLHWHEKLPLALLMAAQALVIFRWYADGNLPASVVSLLPHVTTVVALAASVALDLAVVTTAMARRAGRRSAWGGLTTGAAMLFSSLVALDVYGVFPFGAWLHAAFPIVTFFYAQHLAVVVPRLPAVAPEDTTGREDRIIAALAEIRTQIGVVSDSSPSLAKAEYLCPHCGTNLGSAGAKGAAVKHGHCPHCKPANGNGNGNGQKHEDLKNTEVIA